MFFKKFHDTLAVSISKGIRGSVDNFKSDFHSYSILPRLLLYLEQIAYVVPTYLFVRMLDITIVLFNLDDRVGLAGEQPVLS